MNLSFFTAAVGAEQQQQRLNVHGNNISNVNSFGFRARVPAFSELITNEVDAIEEDYRRGVGARMEDDELDLRPGAYETTGRLLDYAIEGDGFFALRDPDTGDISYTRDGTFIRAQHIVDGESVWLLSDGLGRLVLGRDGEPIEVKDELDEHDIGIWGFQNYNGMSSLFETRVQEVPKNDEVGIINGRSKILKGVIEKSNTDLANEMTKVIEAQRAFSLMLKMVSTSDDIETTTNGLRS